MILCAKLQIPNEPVCLRIARHYAIKPLQQLGVTDDDACRVETIIGEACNNIVQHGWSEGRHLYEVNLTYYADKVKIAVIGGATQFDVCRVPEPMPGQIGGYGLSIIRKMSDKAKITCTGGRTKVLAEVKLHYQSAKSMEYAQDIDTAYSPTSH